MAVPSRWVFAIGILGAGGQLLLFHAVRIGPPYLIFPIISLSPALTIALSFTLLKERTGKLGLAGIGLALLALPLFDYRADGELAGLRALVRARTGDPGRLGHPAYFIKLANATMDAASIFFYMTLSGLLFAPVALAMTDFSQNPSTTELTVRVCSRHPGAERHRCAHAGVRLPVRQGHHCVTSSSTRGAAPDRDHFARARWRHARPFKLAGIVLALLCRADALRCNRRNRHEAVARHHCAPQAGAGRLESIRSAPRIPGSSRPRCTSRRPAAHRS